jgi:copper chaperone
MQRAPRVSGILAFELADSVAEPVMIELNVNDMTCGGCVASITRVVQGLDPDARVEANLETRRVKIVSVIDTEAVVAAIAHAGYHPVAV